MSTELEELYQFLNDTRALVRTHAVDTVAGLTASSEGLAIIRSYPKLADGLLNRLSDSDPGIAGDAFRGVVNLTGDPELALRMIEKDLVTLAVATVLAPTAMFSDLAAMILSNLSRNELGCARILATNTPEEGKALYALAEAFCKGEFNYNKGASLHFLAAVLSNVSQSVLGRKLILSKEHSLLPRLLTHLDHPDRIRRAGVAGVIKNCCFEPSAHPYLLGEQVDVLSFLLLPLCGPEEFTEEEMEGMPDVCQYLPDTKTREPDPEIRKILVEALYQLCATKFGRENLRAKKVYPIIREMHKKEKDEEVDKACDILVQVLIGDESGYENLKEVELPKSYVDQLTAQEEKLKKEGPPKEQDAIMIGHGQK